MGLIGFGAIGQAVAERLRPFGATVRYSARHQRAAELEARLAVQHVGLEELLRVSSIVSLHLPLTEQTRGLLGAAALARMPQGAYLSGVNAGREWLRAYERTTERAERCLREHLAPMVAASERGAAPVRQSVAA